MQCFSGSISEELGDKELKSKAFFFLGWSDSELEKYEQSKEISKESPRVAKKEEDKTLQAEASGCSGKPENFRKVSRLSEDEIAEVLTKTERKGIKPHSSRYPIAFILQLSTRRLVFMCSLAMFFR